MKIYRSILFPIIVSMIFLGCQKDVTPTLAVSTNQAEIANFNGKLEITVSSNSNWTATVSDIWCTISPMSGHGNGVITITAANNFSGTARSVSLKVYCQELLESVSITQSYSQLSVDADSFTFDKEASSKVLTITSNTKWKIDVPSSVNWLTLVPSSGEGNAIVTLTSQTNNSGPARSADLLLKYGSSQKIISVTQKRSLNTPPTLPQLKYPADKATNVGTIPGFSWSESTDADNDLVSYTLYYSKDNLTWSEAGTVKTQLYLSSHLDENTTYFWKVKATDLYGDFVISPTYSFTTGLKSGYADGEYGIHKDATLGIGGAAAEILFLGDGFTAADFQKGALFEQLVQEGVDDFFSVEPFKSYKNYFRIYKQAAYSADSGVTQEDKKIYKSTVFNTSFNGGSSISVNSDKVFKYAKKIPGVDDARLKKMLIIVLVNQDRYAGTTYMWSDGTAIALCPVSRSTTEGSKFLNLLLHEGGGHGFGRLADEYISYDGKELPASNKTEAESFTSQGFFANIDFTSDQALIKWKHFFGQQGYDQKLGGRVGVFQGAYLYSFGVWRPETSSCMVYNEPYYNAPSRETMVKRILTESGYTYSFSDFVDKDIVKAPASKVQVYTKSVNPLTFVPLAPPVLNSRK